MTLSKILKERRFTSLAAVLSLLSGIPVQPVLLLPPNTSYSTGSTEASSHNQMSGSAHQSWEDEAVLEKSLLGDLYEKDEGILEKLGFRSENKTTPWFNGAIPDSSVAITNQKDGEVSQKSGFEKRKILTAFTFLFLAAGTTYFAMRNNKKKNNKPGPGNRTPGTPPGGNTENNNNLGTKINLPNVGSVVNTRLPSELAPVIENCTTAINSFLDRNDENIQDDTLGNTLAQVSQTATSRISSLSNEELKKTALEVLKIKAVKDRTALLREERDGMSGPLPAHSRVYARFIVKGADKLAEMDIPFDWAKLVDASSQGKELEDLQRAASVLGAISYSSFSTELYQKIIDGASSPMEIRERLVAAHYLLLEAISSAVELRQSNSAVGTLEALAAKRFRDIVASIDNSNTQQNSTNYIEQLVRAGSEENRRRIAENVVRQAIINPSAYRTGIND